MATTKTYNVTYLADGDVCNKTDTFCGTIQEIRAEIAKYATVIKMWEHGVEEEISDEQQEQIDGISQALEHGFTHADFFRADDYHDDCGDR